MKSSLSTKFSRPSSSSFPLFSLFNHCCIFTPPQNPSFIHVKPTTNMTMPSLNSSPNRTHYLYAQASRLSPGENQVTVGPMFAGKTTTILRRSRSEIIGARCSQGVVISHFSYLDETLKGLCFSGRLGEAVGLLCRSGLQVDSQSYSLLLQDCIFRKEYWKGRRIHSQMVIVGFDPDEYLKVKLLILYAKSGDLHTAHILFDKLLSRTLVSWNAMIAGYVQKGLEVVGLSLYHSMRQCGLEPDQYTFASVFRACSSLAILEQGKRAHSVLIKSQISGNVVVNSALMDMYFKCSCPYDGHLVFDKSTERNVITWTALISGYGQHGRVVEVLESFRMMINEGFRPNYVTFLAVLFACSHGGLVNEGWEFFLSMKRDYGIQPGGKHYAAIVDLLARSGRLREAYEFVRNSPFKEHPVIWGAFLGAGKIYGDMDLVKLAAKSFFELEQDNAGKYVVLSNAYASFGLWDNVSVIRSAMKELGVKKEPGYSMIEVQTEVHFFYMGHNAHKQTEDIYELIKEVTWIIKDAGYVPDLSSFWQED